MRIITNVVPPTEANISKAAKLLKDGGIIGLPTETVYGLAANALDPGAVQKIFTVKGRPQDNPLIVHICDLEMLYPLVKDLPDTALKLADIFWPGPFTMVLPKSSLVPDVISAGLETVAIRFPSHPIANAVIKECGFPLAAPSANLSGKPSPTTAQHVLEDLNGKIPLILDGGQCTVGLESTVVAIEGDTVRMLRPGAVTPGMLRQHCVNLEIADAVLNKLEEGETAQSPGMKYRHYSPKADIIILNGSLENFKKYIDKNNSQGTYALVFGGESRKLSIPALEYGANPDEQAKELFSMLRKLDEVGARTVYVRCPDKEELGLAVYNRLIRAAGFKEIFL